MDIIKYITIVSWINISMIVLHSIAVTWVNTSINRDVKIGKIKATQEELRRVYYAQRYRYDAEVFVLSLAWILYKW